jgi:CO/xanthine dehydrogenase Mo-binding subunit
VDGTEKVAGRAVYAADVELPGLCHAAIVRSPLPHACITGVEVRFAAAAPGVLAVLTGEDVAGLRYGRRVRDIPVLAESEVRFIGERVAAVVAETRDQAERAAELVQVEYEELPAVLSAEAAVEPGAPAVHEAPWTFPGAVIRQADGRNLQSLGTHGSLEAAERALAASAHVVDRTYTTATGHQGYLEPHACVASFEGDVLHLWIANKSPYRLRGQVAECLGLEPGAVVVHPVALGADFGGKGSPMDGPLCAVLARRVERPVKLAVRYTDDLLATNPRHPTRSRVRLGCDRDGRLTALAVDVLADGGAYAGFKPRPTVDLHGVEEVGASYRLPIVHLSSRIVYTHTVPRGHMRAPGAPQANFAFESALDELAATASIDPIEIRRRNLLATGEADREDIVFAEHRGRRTLAAALAAYRPLPVPPGWRHGRGVAIYSRPSSSGGRTSVRLIPAGAGVRAEVPMPENGAGGHTAVRNGLARLLGLEPRLVEVVQVPTDALPHDDGVGGSRVTAGLSRILARAAAAYREQGGREPVTVETGDAGPEEKLTCYCTQLAQVAVDPESGQVRVLEILSAVDVAEVLNPGSLRAQLEGGAVMGFGFACLEDLLVEEGRVWAANLGEFKLPSSRDVPALRTVLVRGARGLGALNVKPAGELTNVPTAAAVANAVAAAAGVRIRGLPLRAERVWALLERQVPA